MIDIKTFAIRIYSLPGVADACLEAQDKADVDVPLLLFCCWHGAFFGKLPVTVLTSGMQSANLMGTHVITPLRTSRRWMKLQPAPDESWHKLREQIKAAELKAELLLLETLEAAVLSTQPDLSGTAQDSPGTIEQNIQHNMQMYLDAAHLCHCPSDCLKIVSAASLRILQREQPPASV